MSKIHKPAHLQVFKNGSRFRIAFSDGTVSKETTSESEVLLVLQEAEGSGKLLSVEVLELRKQMAAFFHPPSDQKILVIIGGASEAAWTDPDDIVESSDEEDDCGDDDSPENLLRRTKTFLN